MGGNALSCGSVRLTKKDYERVAADVVARLNAVLPGNRVYAIESYRSKADFGDLDVLIESTGYDPLAVAQALGAVEVVENGPVTSIGLAARADVEGLDGNIFQVDLIRSAPEEFEFTSRYFRFSDMGNLVGLVADAMSVSLRHDGLIYHFQEGDYMFREIVLTRDYAQALPFLGYDPKRFAEGFEDLDEIFQYVAQTPFFNRDIYLLENQNAISRARNRKRPTYSAFLKWCESHSDLPKFEFPDEKKTWLRRIAAFFPDFQAQYDQAANDLARQREVKTRFNGKFVSELTGLQGKELGGLMDQIRESFGSPETMQAFILASDEAVLAARVHKVLAESCQAPADFGQGADIRSETPRG